MKKLMALFLSIGLILSMAGCAGKQTTAGDDAMVAENTETGTDSQNGMVAADSGEKEAVPQKAEIKIRYADVQAENDTETLAAQELAKIVSEKSNGRIEVQVFPSGQLGDMADIIQSVQSGAIEMCRNNPGWLADAGAARMNVLSFPFIFEDLDHANRILESEVGTALLEDIQKNNLKMIGLGYLEPSARYFFFKNKPVTKMSDMKGLKLRVPTNQLNADMVEAFGASATPVAYNELYSALQTGLVDGAENPLKGFTNMKFGEVCKYFTLNPHQYEASVVLVSETFWNTLAEEDKQILKDSMAEAAAYYKEISADMYDQYIKEDEAVGVEFANVENQQEWQDAVEPLYEKYGVGVEDLVEKIKELKDN